MSVEKNRDYNIVGSRLDLQQLMNSGAASTGRVLDKNVSAIVCISLRGQTVIPIEYTCSSCGKSSAEPKYVKASKSDLINYT